MPQIVLRDYIKDDLGEGIENVRARAYAIQEDGTKAATHAAEDFSTSPDGEWELVLDTEVSPTGTFAVELFDSTTGEVRWREPDIGVQILHLIGPHGTAPIPDGSVVGSKLGPLAVQNANIADGTITFQKLEGGRPFVRTDDDTVKSITIGNTFPAIPEAGDIYIRNVGEAGAVGNHHIYLWDEGAGEWYIVASYTNPANLLSLGSSVSVDDDDIFTSSTTNSLQELLDGIVSQLKEIGGGSTWTSPYEGASQLDLVNNNGFGQNLASSWISITSTQAWATLNSVNLQQGTYLLWGVVEIDFPSEVTLSARFSGEGTSTLDYTLTAKEGTIPVMQVVTITSSSAVVQLQARGGPDDGSARGSLLYLKVS